MFYANYLINSIIRFKFLQLKAELDVETLRKKKEVKAAAEPHSSRNHPHSATQRYEFI
jgi:hypothetical protein